MRGEKKNLRCKPGLPKGGKKGGKRGVISSRFRTSFRRLKKKGEKKDPKMSNLEKSQSSRKGGKKENELGPAFSSCLEVAEGEKEGERKLG